jgi:ABC-2 type transport system permease protein
MLILMGPWIMAFPIVRNPDSAAAVALSFVPPVNAFVMMMRLASSTPPPTWQVLLSLAIGVAAAWGAIWFAAKVFRIGLLMHGKPPDLRTLLRWARMA